MSLPEISIPLELPIDIPLLAHPAVVHFVIAIPIIILLLEIINLVFKKRALSIFSLFLITLVAIFMSLAYFTGSVDGKEAYPLLVAEGQAELKEHKLLGIYLVYASVAMILLKLLFMAFSRVVAKLFFILLLLGFIAITLKQGKDGGELVYQYGANNQALSAMESDKDDLQDEYDELEEKFKALSESSSTKEDKSTKEAEEPAKEEAVKEEPTKEEPAKEEAKTEEVAKEEATKEEPAKEDEAIKEEVKEEPKAEATTTEEHKVAEEVASTPKETLTHEVKEVVKETTSTVSLEIPDDSKETHE